MTDIVLQGLIQIGETPELSFVVKATIVMAWASARPNW